MADEDNERMVVEGGGEGGRGVERWWQRVERRKTHQ